MNMSRREHVTRYHTAMSAAGFTYEEADRIRRDAERLHTWAEHECNGDIERDEETGKTFRTYNHSGPGPIKRYPCRDTETPATKRIETTAAARGYKAMFQGDPRGWPVEICKPEDVKDAHNYNGISVPIR